MNADKFRAYLETGNIIRLANGRLGVVLGDVIIVSAPDRSSVIAEGFSKYITDPFTCEYMGDRVMFGPEAETQYRITEIWTCNSDSQTLDDINLIFTGCTTELNTELGWHCLYNESRDYVVELTIDEISQRLGYRVRIASDAVGA